MNEKKSLIKIKRDFLKETVLEGKKKSLGGLSTSRVCNGRGRIFYAFLVIRETLECKRVQSNLGENHEIYFDV